MTPEPTGYETFLNELIERLVKLDIYVLVYRLSGLSADEIRLVEAG